MSLNVPASTGLPATPGLWFERPLSVWLLSLLFAAGWLYHLDAVSLAPPVDNIEQLIWMHALEWGYYKHPPLPTWLVWGAVQLMGWTRWATYTVGAACTLVSMAVFWQLLRELRGPRYAFMALLAAYCVTFYNGRLYYYNHNTVLTVWVAVSAWLWWRLLSQPRLLWWGLLGAVAALGMLSKYQYALTLGSGGLLYLYLGLWRQPVHRWGLALAAGVGAALLAPHIWWLLHTHDGPLQYAMQSSLGVDLGPLARTRWSLQWALDWLFNRCLPAWALLLVVRRWAQDRSVLPDPQTPLTERRQALIVLWGVFPLLSMMGMGLLFGADLQLQWGTAFALWTVPVIMDVLGISERRLRSVQGTPRTVLVVFVLLQAALMTLSYITSPVGPRSSHHWRDFPAKALAEAIGPAARAAIGGPIQVISGEEGPAGAVALCLPEHPLVLIEGNVGRSPWLHPETLAHEPVLELWGPGAGPNDAMTTLGGWRWKIRWPAPSVAAP